jgi:diguanylate cyclase (GGDEF)-like protein
MSANARNITSLVRPSVTGHATGMNRAATLSILAPDARQALQALLDAGGSVSILLFEIQDFYVFTRIYGQEAADAIVSAADATLSGLARDRVQGLPFTSLDRLEPGTFLLTVGSTGQDTLDVLTRTGTILRLGLRARLKSDVINLTGQEVDVAFGAAALPPVKAGRFERALHSALADAARMIRAGLDPAGAALVGEFRQILSTPFVRSLYQPIVDLGDGSIFAWEALARGPAGSTFESPPMLFGFAEEHNLVFPLERACRTAAISGFGPREPGRKLFLNVHPRTLADPCFSPGETRALLAARGLSSHDVVLEITERHSTKDFSLFHRTLEHYRNEGFKVAVDDVGAGHSGLWSLAEIRPDFIKLDMSLVRGIDVSPTKRALLETLLIFADKVGGKIVAEGIETARELSALVAMGAHYGQGYHLAKPAAPRPDVNLEALGAIKRLRRGTPEAVKCSAPIGLNASEPYRMDSTALVSELKRFFDDNPGIECVAVTREDEPVGLVTRGLMDRALSSRYGLALYFNRPVTKIMDPSPLCVDWNTPLETAAQAAMSRERGKEYDHVLVMRDGRLVGLASVRAIMDAMAHIQVEMAKGANPLTGLPGNLAIERELAQCHCTGSNVSFIYADLDNFKVYNDAYGFKAGDQVILLTARILAWALRRHGTRDSFLGHVGGDDFVMRTTSVKAERVCKAVIRCFSRIIRRCYSESDRLRGHVVGKDRTGNETVFGFVSASLAIVDCPIGATPEDVSLQAAQMKKYAKSIPGNVWVRDRRGGEGSDAGQHSLGDRYIPNHRGSA